MIDVDLVPKHRERLLVRLENSPLATTAALRGMLTAAENPKLGGWTMALWEFDDLQRSLDELRVEEEGFMSDDAAAALKEWRDWRDWSIALKTINPNARNILTEIAGWKTEPYPDQLQCLNFHVWCGRSVEGGETGIGKSLTVLYTYLYWRTLAKAKGLFICANSGKLDWEEQIKAHSNARCTVVGNGTQLVLRDIEAYQASDSDILVVHYDALQQVKVMKAILGLQFGYIALDEAHYIKHKDTKRHKAVMAIVKNNKKVRMTCATGTALDGSPKSAWALLRLTMPGYLPGFSTFRDFFTEREIKFYHGRKMMVDKGYKNLRRLKDMLAPVTVRFLKAEVTGRPSKIFKTRLAMLTGEQKLCYERIRLAVKSSVEQMGEQSVSMMEISNRLLRLRQILNHPHMANFPDYKGDPCKYRELDDILEEICSDPAAQVLVWTQWRESVEHLVKRYKQYGAIALYGGSDNAEVRDEVRAKRARVVVAIPEKAGTSIDWLSCCRTAVYLEKPWSLTLYRQSLDRIDRRSNTDAACIITIECPDTVDQMVNAVLAQKQGVFDAMTLDDEKLVALGKADLLRYLH